MTSLIQDLRHGLRLLARAPGFTAVALLTLTIGIAANTTIFSVVNTLLLQPLPYEDADRLAVVWEHNLPRDRKTNVVGPANFLHWREMNGSFEDLAALTFTFNLTITGRGEPEEFPAQLVSAQLFPILGARPALGRTFAAEEDRPGSRLVVISDRLWRSRFDASPGILQQSIVVQGIAHTVVGVMPPGFSILDRSVDLWLPLGLPPEARTPRGRSLTVVGRLKPGVTLDEAHADMRRVAAALTEQFPDFNTGWSANVVSLRDQLTGDVRPALLVLLGAVGFVLLIACANVANLLLARATARQRELAVRAALGAGRGRLIRQLAAESLVLAGAGGVAGLVVAWWALRVLTSFAADRLPVQRLEAATIDNTVLLFTLGASLLSGVMFGLVPALTAAGTALTDALREGGRTGTGRRGARARSAFVVVQVALALVLLVGAGLLVRSFMNLINVDPGFDPSRSVTMRISLPGARYQGATTARQFYDRLFAQIDALPGVQAAGAISFLPLNGLGAATRFEIVDRPQPPAGQEPVADVRVISDEYFRAMGIPLVRGRLFDLANDADASNKVIVNETMVRTHWPHDDPIGKRIRVSWSDDREDEIIGIVGDVRLTTLDAAPRPTTYWPYPRSPYNTMTLAIRTAGDPRSLVNAVTGIVRKMDPLLAVADVRTMEEVVSDSVTQQRFTATLLGIFAAAALLLAAVGIYGVMAYSVTQRAQEIGIRMALGAQGRDVLRMIVGQAAVLAGAGIVLGGLGALLLTRSMDSLLFGVEPADPLTFGAVAASLGATALLASYIPGRRATRVDPALALRAE